MVSVSKIENTLTGMRKKDMPIPSAKSSKLSFGKRPNAALAEAVVNNSSMMSKFLVKMGQNDGEILNSIVTFLGTAFVAPIFIAFNPFAKEDKETKIYSAWRQPISALIAAVMQVGVNIKYNHHLNNLASRGLFDRADLRAAPLPSYVRGIIKAKYPELSGKELAQKVEEEQYRLRDEHIDSVRRSMTTEEYNGITDASLVDARTRKQAEKQIKQEQIDALASLSKNEQKTFLKPLVDERAVKLAKEQVEHSARVKEQLREWVQEAIKEKTPTSVSYKMPFAEFVQSKKQLAVSLADDAANASIIKEAAEKLARYTGFDRIKFHGDSYDQILRNMRIKKWVLTQAEAAKDVLKSYNRWTGLVISLITLPISCGLLNYIYPRIMEKIMPEVVAKRKAKQAQEAAAANTPKLNVKEGSN